MVATGNLFADIPARLAQEEITTLMSAPDLRIERIVSRGQSSPPGFWYDQAQAEWVIVLAGSALVMFEGDSAPTRMEPGTHVHIPAHRRHRVESTDPVQATVWLAVHHR
jgi:cupin 2 domain-containing protein